MYYDVVIVKNLKPELKTAMSYMMIRFTNASIVLRSLTMRKCLKNICKLFTMIAMEIVLGFKVSVTLREFLKLKKNL